MAEFNPDEYLKGSATFNPDEYLGIPKAPAKQQYKSVLILMN